MSSAELIEVEQQLAELYTAPGGERSVTEVRVTLYQIMEASMTITTSLYDSAVCDVLMEALTLDGYGATCTAAVSGDKYTFTLEYPLEPAVQVAAKTAEIKSFVVTVTFTEAMTATAANLRRRRLDALSIAGVDPPTTSVRARVTIVVKVLASSRPNSYEWLQVQSSAVQAVAGSIDANLVSNTLTAALPNLTGLVVTAPSLTVSETNGPPTTPPPRAPPSPTPPPPTTPPASCSNPCTDSMRMDGTQLTCLYWSELSFKTAPLRRVPRPSLVPTYFLCPPTLDSEGLEVVRPCMWLPRVRQQGGSGL